MSFLWFKGKKQERKKRRPKGKYRVVFGVSHHDETGRNYNRIPFLDPAMGREAQRIRGNCSYILPCVLSICSFCFSIGWHSVLIRSHASIMVQHIDNLQFERWWKRWLKSADRCYIFRWLNVIEFSKRRIFTYLLLRKTDDRLSIVFYS